MVVSVDKIEKLLDMFRHHPEVDVLKVKLLIAASALCGVKGLQQALGVKDDGIFGPITKKALDDTDTNDLVEKLIRNSDVVEQLKIA